MSQGAKCFNTPIFHTTCLNKLVDEYNNTYHHSIGKNPVMLIIILWLKKLNGVLKPLNFKSVIESELLNKRIFLVRVTLEIGKEKLLLLILC